MFGVSQRLTHAKRVAAMTLSGQTRGARIAGMFEFLFDILIRDFNSAVLRPVQQQRSQMFYRGKGPQRHGRPALAFTRCWDLSGILIVAAEAIGIQTMFMQKKKKKEIQPCNLDTII